MPSLGSPRRLSLRVRAYLIAFARAQGKGRKVDSFFKISERKSTIGNEIIGGLTTFLAMAYIIAVNPNMLVVAGVPFDAALTATCFGAAIMTIAMGLIANRPIALASGMGINAIVAYTLCLGGAAVDWRVAMAIVFLEGIVILILVACGLRKAVMDAIPVSLRHAIGIGIGLFIAFIGLQNAKIVLPDSSTVAGLYSLSSYNANLQSAATLNGTEYVAGTFNDVGITVLLAVIGVILTAVLVVRNVKGNILWGILATWILGMICQACGLYVPNPANGFYSLFPDFSNGLSIPSLAPIFGKLDFSILKTGEFFVIMFAFLFVDMFDTIGTLIGVSSKANMLDKSGKLPRIKGALMADAVATCAGAVLGTSTTTTFVESASGVSEGGRTGLTAVTTAILFGLALFLSPIFLAIPSFATAPALIVVGFYMLTNVVNIDFSDLSEAIPCYICIGAMPFFYSISEGIAMGVISYVAIQILSGKAKEKKISVIMYILAVLFILKYLLL